MYAYAYTSVLALAQGHSEEGSIPIRKFRGTCQKGWPSHFQGYKSSCLQYSSTLLKLPVSM